MADFETAQDTAQDLDAQIAAVRANIRDLTEQAAAYSGAADEDRNADRIAEQEELLAQLQKRRALLPE